MNISIKGTNLKLNDSIKAYLQDKIGSLEKYITVLEVRVELEKDRHHQTGLVYRAEVMLFVGGKIVRAEAKGQDVYAAIDLVEPKLKEQIAKFKDKRTTLQRRGARSGKRKK